MVKVELNGVIQVVPDATWYLKAGWKLVKETKKKEEEKVVSDSEKITSKQSNN